MELILRPLKSKDEQFFLEAYQRLGSDDLSWLTFVWQPGMNFEEHLKILEERSLGINVLPGRVPDTMLYAFQGEQIVGRVSIRHELNEHLLNVGGHVGYYVFQDSRGKGVGTEILRMSLLYCSQKIGLSRILLTCDDDNLGSIRTIEKNHGKLENVILFEGKSKRRYWINLT